jgi:CDP-diacylglycerol--glycerol-3-phosphate 3-phosphatidyltransferase
MSVSSRLGWPNRITISRILAIGPFVVCLLHLNEPGQAVWRWTAVGLFSLMALSDLADGYLARRLRDESPLGRFLDPLADKLLVTVAVVILCIRGVHDGVGDTVLRLPNWVVVTAIGKDLIVSLGFAIVYMSTGRVFIQPRWLGKWCTTLQLALVLSMLLWPVLPAAVGSLPQWLWIAASVLAIAATLDYIRLGNRFVAAAASDGPAPGESSDER